MSERADSAVGLLSKGSAPIRTTLPSSKPVTMVRSYTIPCCSRHAWNGDYHSNQRTGQARHAFGGRWCAEPPNHGLTMSQILKFPDSVSRRTPKDGAPEEAVAATEALLDDQHNEEGR